MTRAVCVAAVGLMLAGGAWAQSCTTGFQPGGPGATGIYDSFSAYVQPMTEFQGRLIVGGAFSAAGPVATNCIAAYDPVTDTWSALGRGADLGFTNGYGAALARFTVNGTPSLVFGGFFTGMRNSDGTTVPDTASLAAWDGTRWNSIVTGTGRSVWTLLDWEQSPGVHRLVVGGGGPVGNTPAAGIALFDGANWSTVAPGDTGIAGSFSPVVFCSAVYAGNLYIGGRFDSVNGVAAPNIARWNGSAWQRPGVLGNGGAVSDVSSRCVFDDGTGAKLYAGGYQLSAGGQATTVAAFNGATWSRVGQNLGGRGTSLAVFDDGTGPKLYMGMTADATQRYIYRLEGGSWTPVDGGVTTPIAGNFPSVFGLYASGRRLYVGGNFQIAGGETAYGVAQYGPCGAVCRADFNADGAVGLQDLFDFLRSYFNGEARADVNGVGGVTIQDVFDFLVAYFAGC